MILAQWLQYNIVSVMNNFFNPSMRKKFRIGTTPTVTILNIKSIPFLILVTIYFYQASSLARPDSTPIDIGVESGCVRLSGILVTFNADAQDANFWLCILIVCSRYS